jgi:hypothetical protein
MDRKVIEPSIWRFSGYNYMLKSPSANLLYHEIPKNASTSIKNLLFKTEQEAKGVKIADVSMDFTVWSKLFPDMLVDKNTLPLDGFLSFCFIRNPYQRLVSGYKNTGHKFRLEGYTFDEFIFSLKQRLQRPPSDVLNNHFKTIDHFVPISDNNLDVDFIGKVESYNEDIVTIFDMVGRQVNTDLPVKNKSEKYEYQDFYSAQTKKIVEELYRFEIELGKYLF